MKSLFENYRTRSRERGFTLLEIVLVVAVGLGLIVGGIVFFGQAQSSSELTDKQRAFVGISTEIRSQARSMPSFNRIGGGAGDAAVDDPGVKTNSVIAASAIPASQFRNVAITTAGQTFTITMTALEPTVCNRLAASDLGPGTTITATNCATGALAVTYSR